MTLDLSQEQIQALVNYLASRPWAEVNALLVPMIDQINKAQQLPAEPPALRAVES